jgi:hypothetical protein
MQCVERDVDTPDSEQDPRREAQHLGQAARIAASTSSHSATRRTRSG